MMETFNSISATLARLLPAPVAQPIVRSFGRDQCLPEGSAGVPIMRNASYFELRVNQLSLANNVAYFAVYDPLVVITVAFDHGDQRIEVPAVLGPGSIQKHVESGAPLFGTILTDVKVIGPYAYRGRDITVSVRFYRVKRMSYTSALLKVVERLSSVIGMQQIGALANAGGALIDGLAGLMGGDDTVCLAAYQFSLPRSNTVPVQSEYATLIVPTVPVDVDRLVVRDGRLAVKDGGRERALAGDFVLFSIAGVQRREDEQFFAAHALKQQALRIIGEGAPSRKRAKAIMLSALQQLRESDDFTKFEADLLYEEWLKEFSVQCVRYDGGPPMSASDRIGSLPPVANDLNQAIDRLAL